MSSEEMKTYLELLYKKCSKSNKAKFDDYLKKECDVEDVDLTKCADIICKDKKQCDKVIHYLEDLSEKLDEVSRWTGRNRSEVVRDSLRRYLAIQKFRQLRQEMLPYAEARGILADEDVFREIS